MLQSGAAFFQVEELPAYAPSGEGAHLYLEVEKRDLTTEVVAGALARLLDRPRGAVGFAGRKDRQAVTRQWFSVEGAVSPPCDADVRIGGGHFRVLQVSRHTNKLRKGHLRGNRFSLGLHADLPGDRLDAALQAISGEGIPNRFGPQRYGPGGSNLRIARAWARGDAAEAVRFVVDPSGSWRSGDPLPPRSRGRDGRDRVLGALAVEPGRPDLALRAAGADFRRLIASSAQAAVFDAVLDGRERAGLLRSLRAGDLAVRPYGRTAFRCVAADLPALGRDLERGEVSPTGPLPGSSKFPPSPEVDAEERAWSRHVDVDWAWFDRGGVFRSPGDRRPLLVHLLEVPRLAPGDGVLWLHFALPRGSYATQVLAELGERLA